MVGVTGFEPVTLRLSSACSNQLSYTPIKPNWLAESWLAERISPAFALFWRGSLALRFAASEDWWS